MHTYIHIYIYTCRNKNMHAQRLKFRKKHIFTLPGSIHGSV